MKKKSLVYVVHCIDTEGPLNENIKATFERLNNIFNIKLKPNKKNLNMIQNQKINFNGKEKIIAKTFSKELLNYNSNWQQIIKMNKKITSNKYRNQFKDSFGNGWIFNWFIMDHVGFKKNPRNRNLGYHKIWNKYLSLYSKKENNDGFYFHHHPLPFSQSADHCATHFFNFKPIIFEILNRKIIDLKWFPSVYRPGFHTIRPDSNWFLEQFIPFDYSNQRVNSKDNNKSDLTDGRFGDWRRASKSWSPYHPSHDDYQKPGNSRRWTARCLNVGTRHRLLKYSDVLQAFKEANNKSVILSFADHDYRDISLDIDYVFQLIKKASKRYPKIKFKWCNAREAMRDSLNLKKEKNVIISQKLNGNIFSLKFNKQIFGPQPYFVIQTKKGEYFHDNFDIQKNFFEWSYTFDEHTIEKKSIKKVGWAANDKFGTTYISVFDIKNPKYKIKII